MIVFLIFLLVYFSGDKLSTSLLIVKFLFLLIANGQQLSLLVALIITRSLLIFNDGVAAQNRFVKPLRMGH